MRLPIPPVPDSVELSALRTVRPLTLGRFLVLISGKGLIDSKAIMALEVLGKLKIRIPRQESNAAYQLPLCCLQQLHPSWSLQ